MIDSLDPSTTRFLNDLSGIARRLEVAQRQLASGKKLNTVSDDPDQVSLLLQTRSQLDMNARVTTDLGRVKTEVDAGESAGSTSVKLVEQTRVLTAQGATGTATAESRSTIASRLGSILQQLGSLANTTV